MIQKILTSLLFIFCLIAVVQFSFWWAFFIIGGIGAILFSFTKEVLVSAIILDIYYFGGSSHVPVFTIYAFALFAVNLFLKDKLRIYDSYKH